MEFIKSEKFSLPEYCVLCQEWQQNHTSYTCPDLICKLCQNKGHVKLVCPKFYQNTIETTEEPLDEKTMFIFRFHSNLKIKEEPKMAIKTNVKKIRMGMDPVIAQPDSAALNSDKENEEDSTRRYDNDDIPSMEDNDVFEQLIREAENANRDEVFNMTETPGKTEG